jgi:hypothetical protein
MGDLQGVKLFIGFSRPKNTFFPIFSYLIRWFYKAPYSHCYVYWYARSAGVPVHYEASGTSVNFKGNWFVSRYIDPVKTYVVNIERSTYRKLLAFCVNNAGRPYSIKQVIDIIWARYFGRRLFKANGNYAQICSEVVGLILKDVIGEEVEVDLELAGPVEIEEILKANPKFNEIVG